MIPVVVAQHAEESAFCWMLRDAAVRAPHYSLKDLVDLDERVNAHIDGLRVAGDEGWQLCREELSWEEPGEIFAAGVLALERGATEEIDEVLESACSSIETARGMVSALGWLPTTDALPRISELASSTDPAHRRIGLAAAAAHRHDPGVLLTDALGSEGPLRARALRAVGELGRVGFLRACQEAARSEDEEHRFWGAWSAVLLGDAGCLATLRAIAETNGPRSERAAELCARRLSLGESMAWYRGLVAQPALRRIAIRVAGAIGDPSAVPWLLEQMSDDELSRPAGAAFSTITGLDLEYENLDGEAPEGFEAGPTEDPDDEDVAMDADEDLPWPSEPLVAAWWDESHTRFPVETRHLLGQPISKESLNDALRHGTQRARHAAALELALLDPAEPLFEVRARGDRQRKILGLS